MHERWSRSCPLALALVVPDVARATHSWSKGDGCGSKPPGGPLCVPRDERAKDFNCDDADDGEDKKMRRARRPRKSAWLQWGPGGLAGCRWDLPITTIPVPSREILVASITAWPWYSNNPVPRAPTCLKKWTLTAPQPTGHLEATSSLSQATPLQKTACQISLPAEASQRYDAESLLCGCNFQKAATRSSLSVRRSVACPLAVFPPSPRGDRHTSLMACFREVGGRLGERSGR